MWCCRLISALFLGSSCLWLAPARAQFNEDLPAANPFGAPPELAKQAAPAKSAPAPEKLAPAQAEGPTPFLTRLADDSQIKIEITEPTIAIATK